MAHHGWVSYFSLRSNATPIPGLTRIIPTVTIELFFSPSFIWRMLLRKKKAPLTAPIAALTVRVKARTQLTIPKYAWIRNSISDRPDKTKTEVPTVWSVLRPRIVSPVIIEAVPLVTAIPDKKSLMTPKRIAWKHESFLLFFSLVWWISSTGIPAQKSNKTIGFLIIGF